MGSEYQEIIDMAASGHAVLVETPYGEAIHFLDSPVPEDQRTPLTHQKLLQIADDFEANRDKWPAEMTR